MESEGVERFYQILQNSYNSSEKLYRGENVQKEIVLIKLCVF